MNIKPMIMSGKVYKHYTGYYVYVITVADAGDEPLVIYREIASGNVLSMKAEDFMAPVEYTFTFIPVDVVGTSLEASTTAELLEELEKRADNPFDGVKSLSEDDAVCSVDYLLGKITSIYDSVNDKDVDTFLQLTQRQFDTYEEAQSFAETHFPHMRCTIVRRVLKVVSE